MSDLLSSLTSAARALDAQRYGLDVTGQNIANVNTPGYVRRSVDLAEVPPPDGTSSGGGVDVVAVQAARAPLILARLRQEQPAASRDGAVTNALATVQVALGAAGSSIDGDLAAFYNAFGALAQNPTASVARQQTVAQGHVLAQSFRTLSASLAQSRADADSGIRSAIEQVNAFATQIATLNAAISGGNTSLSNQAQDRQAVAIDALSALIDVSVVQRSDGGVEISVGNGQALVSGTTAFALSTTTTPPLGFSAIGSHGADVTHDITGGTVGGLLHVRDVLAPGYQSRLDALAYGVVTGVNAAHAGGFDLNGTPSGHFFAPLATATGAAASMAVDASVAADPSLVAAAAAPSAGDNQIARQIAALQDAPLAGVNGTPVGAWSDLVYRVGLDAQSAAQDQQSHQDVITQLQSLRDQISGVSLDEEAGMILRFQRAYEANARFFSAADSALDSLMRMIGG